ncbi:MAG: TonB-dependent receptor [Chitinophagaceae bacterium]
MIKHLLWGLVWIGLGISVMHAQTPCHNTLKGHVYYADNQLPARLVRVTHLETTQSVSCTADGFFEFTSLCEGMFTIRIETPGYKIFQETYNIPRAVPLDIFLQPLSTHLQGVTILGQRQEAVVEPIRKVSSEQRLRTQGLTLGKALEALPGVYNLSTGQSISKPIVHGLHSNRVLIVNNNLRQESQQWGAEHAPEIDAFQAEELQLITGPRCLRYGSDALGGVILMQATPLTSVSEFRWATNTGMFSNGRGGALAGLLETAWKKNPAWTARVQGSLRRSGNLHTPNYVLGNTGFYERSWALGLGYQKKRWSMQWHFSDFFTRLGIVSSSHIGNLSDLYAAFQREQPLDTARFTYRIGFPYQQLNHKTLQWQGTYRINQQHKFEWQYAFQRNRRKEFDKTLQSQQGNGRIEPALDFNLQTHQIDFRWLNQLALGGSRQIGLSSQIQTNEYYASYLIPNYIRYHNGVYGIRQWAKQGWSAEVALRYDFQSLHVFRWEQNQLNEHRFLFHGPALMGGLRLVRSKTSYYFYGGSTWRAPHVNELYSYGIHHSAASFEMGDANLKPERNYQLNVSVTQGKLDQYHWTATAYGQYIDNFIYLKPVFPATQTIKGAFPTFQYTPIPLLMGGLDFTLESPRKTQWPWHIKSSWLIARNINTGYAPVGMPPARLEGELARRIPWASHDPIRMYAGLGYTFRALGLEPSSDYLNPPKAYWLGRLGIETGFHWQNLEGQISLGIDNLFNARYRDYLNRYRYFVHEPGRNFFIQCRIGKH